MTQIEVGEYETAADAFAAIPKPSPHEKRIVGPGIHKANLKEYAIGVIRK